MTGTALPKRLGAPANAEIALWLPALIVLLLHALLAGRYDLFRDELYFIVCGQHPAFGYVDQPPGVPLMAAALFKLGLGAWGVRLPATLAAGALVWLSVRFAQFLGGSRLALWLTALATGFAPMLMGLPAMLGTSTFGPLAWTAVAVLLVRTVRTEEYRLLWFVGLIVGIELQIKYAMLFWVAGLVAGLLVTPQRRLFARRELWTGAAIAALIAVPSFIWQAAHGFPFLELGKAAAGKNADVALGPFIANQFVVMNQAFAVLLVAGLIAPFVSDRLRDLRFVPIACLAVFAIVRLGHGKDYYLAPLYPVLFTIGAVAIAPVFRGITGKATVAMGIAAAMLLSALAAPLTLPILTPPALAQWIKTIGISRQKQERSFANTALPQMFADQLGWHDFSRQVEAAWQRIPAAERAATGIKVDNYGEAAALDVYGKGLPPALSGHNQYYLWGLRGQNPQSLLVIQNDAQSLKPYCKTMIVLGKTYSKWAMAYENGKVIAYCKGVTPPLKTLWPQTKVFM